jgi:hypothetical protein
MATTKIDLGAVVNQAINTAFSYLNSRIGGKANPLNSQGTDSSLKIGNVGGIFGININWMTLGIIGAGIVGVVLLVKKVR